MYKCTAFVTIQYNKGMNILSLYVLPKRGKETGMIPLIYYGDETRNLAFKYLFLSDLIADVKSILKENNFYCECYGVLGAKDYDIYVLNLSDPYPHFSRYVE